MPDNLIYGSFEMKKVFLFIAVWIFCAVPPVFGQGQVQLVTDQQAQDQQAQDQKKEDSGPIFYFSTGYQVLEPNGGEILVIGNVYRVQWEFPETVQNVTIRFSSDGGMNWNIVAYNVPNDGSHLWTVPPRTVDELPGDGRGRGRLGHQRRERRLLHHFRGPGAIQLLGTVKGGRFAD